MSGRTPVGSASPMLKTLPASSHLGRRAQRVEDRPLLTGRGRFGDDAPVRAGTLHAAVLRSPHAHARLLAVRSDKAMALPGVRAVLTAADVQRWSKPFMVGVKAPMELWALAVDKVRYVGEPVAVVVAESRYIAEDALELLEADYEPLPPVTDIRAAIAEGAPVLHEKVGSNVVSGAAYGLVLAVGGATLFGSLARQIAATSTPTSFEKGVIKSRTWVFSSMRDTL